MEISYTLKRECFQLVKGDFNTVALIAASSKYPAIAEVARSFEHENLHTADLKEVARIFGDNKIALIKEIRSRLSIGLWEAKMMADGIFAERDLAKIGRTATGASLLYRNHE